MKLKQRDPTKSNKEQGLFRKYDVRRTDGSDKPGGKHENCNYFVLDLVHDKAAHVALAAYAYAIEKEYPLLAADIWQQLYELWEFPK
jgi:hypothetical protein